MFTGIQQAIEKEFSAERAMDLAAAIHGYDRWSTFAQYEQSGNYIATRLRQFGLEDVELVELPADGTTRIGDWTMPMAWDVEEATLEIVAPANAARRLAHYREEPATLAMWSAPTPPEGIEAEVVLLPENYEIIPNLDVAGKVVFASRHAGQLRKWAAAHGAIGVISDHPGASEPALAHGVCWVNAWVDHRGWGYLATDTPIWGFALTRDEGAYLRRLLEGGTETRIRALVRSWLYAGRFWLPTARLRGEIDGEVLVYAHAYEYGAEDNAAGCALTLEAARTLNALVQRGILPRPKRSIRFIMSWECYGSIPWCVERIYGKGQVVAGLVLDDLGGARSITGGRLKMILNPHCSASFADYALAAIAEACLGEDRGLPYELADWSGGTDHTILLDPLFGVPTPWITESPARFHHTSLDVMSNLDPQAMRREGVLAATYLYFLANAGAPEAAWLAHGTGSLWIDRLRRAQGESLGRLGEQADAEALASLRREAEDKLAYLAECGRAAIRSAHRLVTEGETLDTEAEVDRLGLFAGECSRELERSARARAASEGWSLGEREAESAEGDAQRVPRRLIPGLLTLCSIPRERRPELDRIRGRHDPMWSGVLTFALFWADGERSIAEIARRVRHEFGPLDVDLTAYFCFLEELGYIAWA